jgi:Helix-turn-helix family
MDPIVARKAWRTLEPIHAMIYFVPEAPERYRNVGLADPRAGYFASRSAAMGEASAELVIATFYNFNPATIREVLPAAWQSIRAEELVDARFMAADAALRRLLGDDVIAGAAVAEAAELARRAASAACDDLDGRPLFAAHASLAWPTEPHLVLWHAQTLLREYRGDGHIAALVADGVTGIEALLMHGGTGAIAAGVLQRSRSWDDDAWTAASDRLIDRGLLDPDGTLSQLGSERRQWVEDRTDALALSAYEAIGEDGCDRLRELCRPLSQAIVAAGGQPI